MLIDFMQRFFLSFHHSLCLLIDVLNIICWVESNAPFVSSFAPTLFVLVLEFLEHIALLERELIAFGAFVVVKSSHRNAGFTLKKDICVYGGRKCWFIISQK